jgi:hypothetical protein
MYIHWGGLLVDDHACWIDNDRQYPVLAVRGGRQGSHEREQLVVQNSHGQMHRYNDIIEVKNIRFPWPFVNGIETGLPESECLRSLQPKDRRKTHTSLGKKNVSMTRMGG